MCPQNALLVDDSFGNFSFSYQQTDGNIRTVQMRGIYKLRFPEIQANDTIGKTSQPFSGRSFTKSLPYASFMIYVHTYIKSVDICMYFCVFNYQWYIKVTWKITE